MGELISLVFHRQREPPYSEHLNSLVALIQVARLSPSLRPLQVTIRKSRQNQRCFTQIVQQGAGTDAFADVVRDDGLGHLPNVHMRVERPRQFPRVRAFPSVSRPSAPSLVVARSFSATPAVRDGVSEFDWRPQPDPARHPLSNLIGSRS